MAEKKKFTLFRKQLFNIENLDLKVQPMMINRLNRLVATGLFGNSVEEAAISILGLGIARMETELRRRKIEEENNK